MNAMNQIVRRCLNQALGGLYALADAGATVTRLDVSGRNPILWIDGPPPGVIGTRAVMRIQRHAGQRVAVMVTRVGDCQVQWRALHSTPAVPAAHG
jgi:hypothetical protein